MSKRERRRTADPARCAGHKRDTAGKIQTTSVRSESCRRNSLVSAGSIG
jgi:hypothetical protein